MNGLVPILIWNSIFHAVVSDIQKCVLGSGCNKNIISMHAGGAEEKQKLMASNAKAGTTFK